MSQVAAFIASRISELGKTQTQIASEAGFPKPNIITMIKQGKTKLPLNKIGPVALALECDPSHLLRMCLSEYEPDTWTAIEPYLGSLLKPEEAALIAALRSRSVFPLHPFFDEQQRASMAEFLSSPVPASGPTQTGIAP